MERIHGGLIFSLTVGESAHKGIADRKSKSRFLYGDTVRDSQIEQRFLHSVTRRAPFFQQKMARARKNRVTPVGMTTFYFGTRVET